jgi:hypothetical protein
MSGVHDMGGRPAGWLDLNEHELTWFDKRVDALYVLLTRPPGNLLTTDEIRREIEALSPTDYLRLSYYERWIVAISNLLIEKGIFSRMELNQKLHAITQQLNC